MLLLTFVLLIQRSAFVDGDVIQATSWEMVVVNGRVRYGVESQADDVPTRQLFVFFKVFQRYTHLFDDQNKAINQRCTSPFESSILLPLNSLICFGVKRKMMAK